jgi:hypothetical protein
MPHDLRVHIKAVEKVTNLVNMELHADTRTPAISLTLETKDSHHQHKIHKVINNGIKLFLLVAQGRSAVLVNF